MLREAGMELASLAGTSPADAPATAETYDDPRVLVLQSGVRAVVLDVAAREAAEWSEIAGENGVATWCSGPPARGFTGAINLKRRHGETRALCRIASWWEHVRESYEGLASTLSEWRPRMMECVVRVGRPARVRTAESAGGGVLIQSAYELVEALVAIRGLPEWVTACAGNHSSRSEAAIAGVEDYCVALLHYADGGCATIQAAWGGPAEKRRLSLRSESDSIEFRDAEIRVLDADGRAARGVAVPTDTRVTDLAHFAGAVRGGAAQQAELERHIAAMALIETIYLAARTGQPEAPKKLYEVQQWPLPTF